ncbi:bifunctional methylenetetrahydrofolate dehydrogenase/methenyltetrahydrofolate cyclohydrolase FolD [soil metagenome]
MSAHIIDGRGCARVLKQSVAYEVKQLGEDGLQCGLATVMVGENYSATAYARRLRRVSNELEVPYWHHALPAEASQSDVTTVIDELNADPHVTGILVLRPLPSKVHEPDVFRALSPLKDIESVHPENAGLLALGTPRYVPSTAASIFHLLDSWLDSMGEDRTDFYHRSLIVVVGRSNNVGKPAVSLAYDRQAAVESVDEWASRTTGLGRHTRRADVLIVAAGRAGLIKAEHVNEGAVVIDVGINPVTDASGQTHMVGDVDYSTVSQRVRAITPVPGGVGPVTDVWLIRNTVAAARNLSGLP